MHRYRLELDENERFALIVLLTKPIRTHEYDLVGEDGDLSVNVVSLLRRLLSLTPDNNEQLAPRPPAPAVVQGKAVAGGNSYSPTPAPAPLEVIPGNPITELTITISKVFDSQDGKSLGVTYVIRTADATKSKTIRCWDPKLFEEIRGRVGKITRFRVKEAKGFLNIIGVEK